MWGDLIMPMNDKDRVFYKLCQHCTSIMDGWIPYPSTIIADTTGWKLSYVRKLLRELKQEGLIESELYVDNGEERPILVRGYVVTEKGRKTELYKVAHEIERKICKECFDVDIGDVETHWKILEEGFEVHLNDL